MARTGQSKQRPPRLSQSQGEQTSALNDSSPPSDNPPRMVSVFDDPPRENVLLLSCMDQRLLDDTVRFMNALNLRNRYDQMALAGGAMGVNRLFTPTAGSPSVWKPVFLHHLEAAIDKLHRPIKDVFLVDHLDCGAYKKLNPDEGLASEYRNASISRMAELHATELRVVATLVRDFCDEQRQAAEKDLHHDRVKAWTSIRVSYFIMDLLGEVSQLDVPPGESPSLKR